MAAPRPSRWAGVIAGAGAGVLAIGVGELVAAFGEALASPVVALADTVIRYLPPGVKQPAVELLGQSDKPVFITTIVVITLALAGWIGARALRERRAGVVGFSLLAFLAALASWDDPQLGLAAAVPALAAGAAGLGALQWLLGEVETAAAHATVAAGVDTAQVKEAAAHLEGRERDVSEFLAEGERTRSRGTPRRTVLRGAGLLAVAGVAAGVVGRWLQQRMTVTAERLSLVIPDAAERINLPVPADAHPEVEGLSPAITPTDRFYRIDTAFSVPQVDPSTHEIRVHGMVDRELVIPFAELLDRPMIELPVMLSCVSNEVGGDLVDTAVWQGVLLRDVLDDAGVADDADQLVGRSLDGWTCGFPVEAAYDRPAMLAVRMNGEPLPPAHGFPVRLVTPGLYGYVSATKWLSELELTRFDQFDQYWVRRGWAARAPIKTQSRIDVPRGDSRVAAGTVAVAGVAWAPTSGVGRVEVRIDDGPWEQAELAAPINGISWRQWVYEWEAEPGRHFIAVRATEEGGETQPEERMPPKPDGATGWHTISVTVDDDPRESLGAGS